jgi:hypothetical protein
MTFIRSTGPRQHDLTHSPEGLWQLDGDLLDSSGNSHTLTLETGTEQYGRIGSLQASYFDGASALIRNTADAGLAIIGDMTVELLIAWETDRPGSGVNSDRYMVSHSGTGETEAGNFIYTFASRAAALGLAYFAETGAGTNIGIYGADGYAGVESIAYHYAMVRSSNDVTFYVNGVQLGATSSGLAAPSGGGDGRFRIGQHSSGALITALVSSVKLIASALTAAQVRAEYNRTLG